MAFLCSFSSSWWCRGWSFERLGGTGVHVLASWQHSALYALAVMFVFTATAHFNKVKHDFAGLRAFVSLRSSSGCSSPM